MVLPAALFALALASDATPAPPALRLPTSVRPVRQAVDLALDPDSERFSGTAEIELDVREPLATLWLNASGLTLGAASLRSGRGSARPLQVVPGGEDFVGFRADAELPAGPARLQVAFEGPVSHRDNEGLFAVREGDAWYLFSQFEAIQARRAFPCFDEPGYKIPWSVTLRVPHGAMALSNSPAAASRQEAGKDVVAFAPTPPLPSYLVAFAVGPFEIVDVGASGRRHTPTRLLVPRGRGADTVWARATTPAIVAQLEDYFDRPYPYDKLDQVAIPGAGFAMEHPGLVTYGQSLMVQRQREETISSRREWVSVAAHELAHQWFGDLVTMAWWDDTWLNESFASWLGQKVMERLQPGWGVGLDRVADRSGALAGDSVASARRIRQPIASKDDIFNAFDDITYAKGEAVLEMVEAWLGEDVFRRGVKTYVDRHAFANATAADFTSALAAVAGGDVEKVLGSFLDQTGAPVVTAELDCARRRLGLSQRPYRALGSPSEPKTWTLPVCARFTGRERPICAVLGGEAGSIALDGQACPSGYFANAAGTGYYRIRYSAAEARRALETQALTSAERVALVGDMEALVGSGDVQASDALELVPLLARDEDRHVVVAGIHLVESLEQLVPDSLLPRFEALVRASYGERARALGWTAQPGDGDEVRLLRRSLLQVSAGTGRDPRLAAEAVVLVRRWLDDPSVLDPELVVAAIGAAGASDPALVARLTQEALRTTERERRSRLLGGLAGVRDQSAAREVLALALDERVDPRESISVLFGIGSHRETRRIAFDFLKAHYETLVGRAPQGELSAALYLPWVGAGLCSEDAHVEIEAFFAPRTAAVTGGPRVLAQVLESVDQCVARKRAQQPALAAHLQSASLP